MCESSYDLVRNAKRARTPQRRLVVWRSAPIVKNVPARCVDTEPTEREKPEEGKKPCMAGRVRILPGRSNREATSAGAMWRAERMKMTLKQARQTNKLIVLVRGAFFDSFCDGHKLRGLKGTVTNVTKTENAIVLRCRVERSTVTMEVLAGKPG